MFAEGSAEILHKICRFTGGRPRLDISHTCFCVVCFVLGVLFGYVFTVDESANQSYPVNNMTLKDVAVLVDMEARAAGRGKRYEELAAISAMQMVNAVVSEYRVEAAKDISNSKGNEAMKAWRFSAGYCYTKVNTMLEILKYLHIPVREINYWHIDETDFGYTACEVYYDDSWHYFDPTWGLYFRDSKNNILSLQSVLNLPKEEAYSNLVMDCTNIQNNLSIFKDSLINILEKKAIITIAGNSNIVFDFKKNKSLSYIPTQIGINTNLSGEKCEAKYTIVFDENMKEINIWYTNSSVLEQIDLKDERGNIIDCVRINKDGGVITLGEDISLYHSVTLQASDEDKYGVLNIEKIEGVYKDGTKIYSQ